MKRNGFSSSFSREQVGKLRRLARARQILADGQILPIYGAEGEKFIVFSQGKEGKRLYLVDLEAGTCTCPDYRENQRWNEGWCKHKLAAWLMLRHPQDYRGWLPEWARGPEKAEAVQVALQGSKKGDNGSSSKGQIQAQRRGQGLNKLDKALAELPDEVLERVIKAASVEQQERDYARAVSRDE